MKMCYIFRGIPGSGKSTHASHLVRNGGVVHSTDHWFTVDGVYKLNVKRLSEFHNYNFANFCKSIKNGVETVVLDNTNIRIFEFERYRVFAEANGYMVRVIELRPDPVDAWTRNVHGVPLETVQRMDANFEPAPSSHLLESPSIPRP